MTTKLNIILGAGFSFKAGFPLANDIKNCFDRNLKEKIYRAGSGEWFWEENGSEADIYNSKLGNKWLPYSYIINELVNLYKSSTGQFSNYEDFFQFVKDANHDTLLPAFVKAKKELLNDTKGNLSEWYLHDFDNPQFTHLLDIINYLIANYLRPKRTLEEIIKIYSPFISLISRYEEVNIYTLNHDLLIENIFNRSDIKYSDGFTKENSNIRYGENFQSTFQNKFTASIKLYKLHGSIDTYSFQHAEEKGSALIPDGNYTYFKPDGYWEKHTSYRVNPSTGEVIQKWNYNVIPRFITGTNKTHIIADDLMYSELYKTFTKNLSEQSDLLIIGYSYGDEHINEVLNGNKQIQQVINVNPTQKFPFGEHRVTELNDIADLHKI